MEKIGIFYLIEIIKGRKLQFCVPEIVEPDKIHSEHQGSSWRSSALRKGENLQLWEVFKVVLKYLVRNNLSQD